MLENKAQELAQASASSSSGVKSHRNGNFFGLGFLAAIDALLFEFGVAPEPVFRASGIREKDLKESNFKLPFAVASELLQKCAEASGRENFGLLLGQNMRLSDIGPLVLMVRSAATVRRVLELMLEYLNLNTSAGNLKFEVKANNSILSFSIPEPGLPAENQFYDMSMAFFTNTMRVLCGQTFAASGVSLPRKMPINGADYKRTFNAPIRFGAMHASLVFSAHWLKLSPPTEGELLLGNVHSDADDEQHNRKLKLADRLPKALKQGLLLDRFQAKDVANRLGMHERTLQRLLAKSDTTYREELDKVRFSLGKQMLKYSIMTISEISTALGYSSSSAFIRAFERWSGISPGAWRKVNSTGSGLGQK